MISDVFLDTNIFLDHLLKRNPDSVEVIRLCERKQINGYASSASFYTLTYVITEKIKKKAHPILMEYSGFIQTMPTTQHNLDSALSSPFNDLEDAFQYYTALNKKELDFFITNNVKDYAGVSSRLPVINAKDFIALIKNEK